MRGDSMVGMQTYSQLKIKSEVAAAFKELAKERHWDYSYLLERLLLEHGQGIVIDASPGGPGKNSTAQRDSSNRFGPGQAIDPDEAKAHYDQLKQQMKTVPEPVPTDSSQKIGKNIFDQMPEGAGEALVFRSDLEEQMIREYEPPPGFTVRFEK